MRKHFAEHHLEEWVNVCTTEKILITAKEVQSAVNTYLHCRELQGLSTELECPRPPFSKDAFLDVLAEWVVVDDQVCHASLSTSIFTQPLSHSMLLNAVSFATSFFCFAKSFMMRIFLTAPLCVSVSEWCLRSTFSS